MDNLHDSYFSITHHRYRYVRIMYQIQYTYHQINIPLSSQYCIYDTDSENLSVLDWVHRQGYVIDSNTCMGIVEVGQLECLQYVHEHGANWDSNIVSWAAAFGEIPCLRYALWNGCPYNKKQCMKFVPQRYMDIVSQTFKEYQMDRDRLRYGPSI